MAKNRVFTGRSNGRRGLARLRKKIACLQAEIRYESRRAKSKDRRVADAAKRRKVLLKEQVSGLKAQIKVVQGWLRTTPWVVRAEGLEYMGRKAAQV